MDQRECVHLKEYTAYNGGWQLWTGIQSNPFY